VPPPTPQSRHARLYATDACRARVRNRRLAQALAEVEGRQRSLPLDPAPEPVPPVVDQRVPLEDALVLAGHNALVLARLREGPAAGADLERLLGPGSAWRTRVSDVRRWLRRRGETVTATRVAPRLWLYQIEANL
jgi:hypothetical protein